MLHRHWAGPSQLDPGLDLERHVTRNRNLQLTVNRKSCIEDKEQQAIHKEPINQQTKYNTKLIDNPVLLVLFLFFLFFSLYLLVLAFFLFLFCRSRPSLPTTGGSPLPSHFFAVQIKIYASTSRRTAKTIN
jgi:hypothetical protein